MNQINELRERIARIIHAEWVRLMQKTIAETPAEYNDLSSRLYLKKHWEDTWKPYDRVSERDRTHTRELADKVLDVFFGWLGSLREDVSTDDKAKEDNMFKFELGELLEDNDTEIQGFVVARAEAFANPFDRGNIVRSYLLYSIPGLLTPFASVEGSGTLSMEYGWYNELNLTRIGKRIKIE